MGNCATLLSPQLAKTSGIWYVWAVQRTVRLELKPTPEQAQVLNETLAQFTQAFNQVCAAGWGQGEKNGVRLHHLTYRVTKAACPGLVSDLLIQARVKATEALKSAAARVKQGRKTTCPQSVLCPARYNVHTYKLHWSGSFVRLSTSSGRMNVPFKLPRYAAKNVAQKHLAGLGISLSGALPSDSVSWQASA